MISSTRRAQRQKIKKSMDKKEAMRVGLKATCTTTKKWFGF
jgi:hypothetical protein